MKASPNQAPTFAPLTTVQNDVLRNLRSAFAVCRVVEGERRVAEIAQVELEASRKVIAGYGVTFPDTPAIETLKGANDMLIRYGAALQSILKLSELATPDMDTLNAISSQCRTALGMQSDELLPQ